MSQFPDWLDEADQVLGDVHSSDDDVDRVVNDIIRLDLAATTIDPEVGGVTQITLERVIAVLHARRAQIAVELADIGRERSDLARRHRGVVGYTRAGG